MSTTVLNTKIRLRKDTADNFAKVASTFVPLDGEVCVVDTGATGIRLKVGNGTSTFSSLSYIDYDCDFKQSIIIGYAADGKFYTDTTKSKEVTLYKAHQLYIDYITHTTYYFDGTQLVKISADIPTATSSTAGILKLYTTQGNNTDGTVTQKFITDAIDDIEFAVENSDNSTECLVLSKPW